ncbi:MAG: hypothetical protein KGY41_05235 [Desulfovermiculus sp.]|nr:hypothetical protein [Desulfovermiculus sp.]
MRRSIIQTMTAILLLILATGCAHYQVNEQSTLFDRESGYRFEALEPGPDNSDSLFV